MSTKENTSSVLLNDHVRKLRQGHQVKDTELAGSWASMRTQIFRLWPSGLAVSPWSQHDAPSLQSRRIVEEAMHLQKWRYPEGFGPRLPSGPTCFTCVSLPSCTYHPTHPGFTALWQSALLQMGSLLTTQEIYLETGSYSRERLGSLFPSSKDGMNK